MIAADETGFVFIDANGDEHTTTYADALAQFAALAASSDHEDDEAANIRVVNAVEAWARDMRAALG